MPVERARPSRSDGAGGGASASQPTVNQVERSPRSAATPRSGQRRPARSVPTAVTVATCPDGPAVVWRSSSGPAELERLRDLGASNEHRPPVVVRRERVVRVGHRDEVRDRRAGRLGGRDGPAAGARGEVRRRDLAVVEDDLCAVAVDGRGRRGRLGRDPAVDLAARVAVEVEGARRDDRREVRERVRARRDRLRLERRRRATSSGTSAPTTPVDVGLERRRRSRPGASPGRSRPRACRGTASRRPRAAPGPA